MKVKGKAYLFYFCDVRVRFVFQKGNKWRVDESQIGKVQVKALESQVEVKVLVFFFFKKKLCVFLFDDKSLRATNGVSIPTRLEK